MTAGSTLRAHVAVSPGSAGTAGAVESCRLAIRGWRHHCLIGVSIRPRRSRSAIFVVTAMTSRSQVWWW
jgi:hypothetical protein